MTTALEIRNPDITKLTTPELKRQLIDGLRLTAERLMSLGAVVVELERRGEDLSALRMGMVKHLRAIGGGTLLPEVVVRYAGREMLLNHIAALPITEQQRLIDNPAVPVLIGQELQHVDPLALPYRSLDQVFATDRIRDEKEQRIYLSSKRPKAKRVSAAARQLKAHADHERGGIRIGNAFVPKAEIVLVLSELAGPLTAIEDDNETATVKLTPAEKKRLRALERESGLSEWQLIRQALRACGLI